MQIIGKETRYIGDEQPALRGYRLLITAVLKAGVDVESDDAYVTDDDHLARVGGVTADDRIEVKPWLEREGRWSFVSSDPKAVDLVMFKGLRDGTEKTNL